MREAAGGPWPCRVLLTLRGTRAGSFGGFALKGSKLLRCEVRHLPQHLVIVHPVQIQVVIETSVLFKPAVKVGLN